MSFSTVQTPGLDSAFGFSRLTSLRPLTTHSGAGELLALLELSEEREDENSDDPVPSTPNSEFWGSSAILAKLHAACKGNWRPDPPSASPPRRLGRYQLIGRQGHGSQSQVWKAVQIAPKLAPVALKILPPESSSDPEQRSRFFQAVGLSHRLPSPPWLPTLDVGESDGYVYQAMPLVEGGTLADAISHRRGVMESGLVAPKTWWEGLTESGYRRAIVRLIARIARALAAAHERLVVHRDIKPANILLDRWDERLAFLADLGLARGLDDETPAEEDSSGTLMYMSPEKLLGQVGDERLSDIYALGVTLYEAVALEHPRRIPAGMHRSCVAGYLATTQPSRPATLVPNLPDELDQIIGKAIAHDPAKRYGSAAALAQDLERFGSRTR